MIKGLECAASVVLVLLFVACGSDDDGKGSSTSSSGGTGTSSGGNGTSGGSTGEQACGLQTCRTGQYCKDSVLSTCENGCLGNQNCSADQACSIPAGTSVGTCANNASKMDLGQPCGGDSGCKSGTCLLESGAASGICSQTCSLVTDCPGGFTAWKECGAFPGRGGTFCLPN